MSAGESERKREVKGLYRRERRGRRGLADNSS